jgi:hypothetical protein
MKAIIAQMKSYYNVQGRKRQKNIKEMNAKNALEGKRGTSVGYQYTRILRTQQKKL